MSLDVTDAVILNSATASVRLTHSMVPLAIIVLAMVVSAAVVVLARFMTQLDSELNHVMELSFEDPGSLKPVPAPSIHEPATRSLSIVVPAYNEQDRLGSTLEATISYLQQRRNRKGPHFTYEIIIVDDGSKDGTASLGFDYVRRYGVDAVRVLRLPANRGKGHAVRQGMLRSRGALCLMMDADGATRVSDLDKLEAVLADIQYASYHRKQVTEAATPPADASGPLALVVGSRAHLKEAAVAQRHPLRNFLMIGFHLLVTFVAGSAIKDTQCGFKLFTRRAAAVLYANQRTQRWCFDVELLYLASALGIPVKEVAVDWTEMEGSKIRPTSILHMAWELLTIKAAYQWAPLLSVLGLRGWNVQSELELQRKTK